MSVLRAERQSPRRDQPTAAVRATEVTKVFGTRANPTVALERISLEVAAGEFLCVVGASGCGKTTLLNLVAGLDRPSSGTVEVIDGPRALLFQEAGLFPWLTSRQNVELALKLRGTAKAERKSRAEQLLNVVGLGGFLDHRPHQLSGGMRQRVALARALAQEAPVLLMDEPFGALDAITRDLLHDELEQLWQRNGFSVVFVTHNVREAVRLGDRVVLLTSRPGKVAAEFDLSDIARPRRIEDGNVAERASVITDRLREEVRRHGQ
jgi:NitT/TauT family transport system ATP-binding protein